MAAEPLTIAASIGSAIKFVASACLYVKGVANASDQAQQVADQLHATKTLLKAVKLSMQAIHRPRHFIDLWTPTTNVIIKNIRESITQLNQRLGGGGTRSLEVIGLNTWNRLTWPLEREETLVLQQHLQAHMQMLSMVQDAFML
jgi:hypothetical protein